MSLIRWILVIVSIITLLLGTFIVVSGYFLITNPQQIIDRYRNQFLISINKYCQSTLGVVMRAMVEGYIRMNNTVDQLISSIQSAVNGSFVAEVARVSITFDIKEMPKPPDARAFLASCDSILIDNGLKPLFPGIRSLSCKRNLLAENTPSDLVKHITCAGYNIFNQEVGVVPNSVMATFPDCKNASDIIHQVEANHPGTSLEEIRKAYLANAALPAGSVQVPLTPQQSMLLHEFGTSPVIRDTVAACEKSIQQIKIVPVQDKIDPIFSG